MDFKVQREKKRNALAFILLLSVFVILSVYLVTNIYNTSLITTKYSNKKTNNLLLCSDLNNPFSNINYDKETQKLSFIFENNVKNLTISKLMLISDMNVSKEIKINESFEIFSIEIPINHSVIIRIQECNFDYNITI